MPSTPTDLKSSPPGGTTLRRLHMFQESGRISLIVIFQPDLPLADMKARLVLNRLSSRAQILSTDPPVERLDEIDRLPKFTVLPDRPRPVAMNCAAWRMLRGLSEIQIEPLLLVDRLQTRGDIRDERS